MDEVLQYLKRHGERLDSEIAAATGMTLAKVRLAVSNLAAKGEIMTCRSIRFKDGKQVEAILCRVAGYNLPVGPKKKQEKRD